ncbi:threonine/serine exporter family protein [Parabacteroides pacaensis]|uniref:threonine/serine ThrE exporter family protein n=1 Tax=Parabacteroides pacaensis TaxID=2086575 RepID=UPI000D0FC4EA|nr:threonine/serine exporter family protein [Parabacteroides pacaensis]
MKTNYELKNIAKFIADYATRLLGSGVHTSRVVRNSKRIGESLNVQVRMTTFQKTIVLTIYEEESNDVYTEVIDIPTYPISFELNSDLSSLSWEAYDKHLTLDELIQKYNQAISKPKMDPVFVLFLVAFANASFCKLFGGDWTAIGIVFSATLLGFFAKQQMQKKGVNHFILFVISAFIASLYASVSLTFATTANIAIGTSVLFLIPGVPLINGVIDIVEGHILIGFSRLIHSLLLVVCIAVGLSFTLLLVKNSLL